MNITRWTSVCPKTERFITNRKISAKFFGVEICNIHCPLNSNQKCIFRRQNREHSVRSQNVGKRELQAVVSFEVSARQLGHANVQEGRRPHSTRVLCSLASRQSPSRNENRQPRHHGTSV